MRILIVQTAFLGDIVMTTPLLRELRRAHPRARLSLLTTPLGAELLGGSAPLDELLVLDKAWTTASGLGSYLRLLWRLGRRQFEVAIAAQRSVRTGLLLCCSGAPLRVGFAGAPGAWAYNRRVRWDPERHAIQRYLALAAPAGGEPDRADPTPRLVPDPSAVRQVEALLASSGLDGGRALLCVAPGSARRTKRWLPEGFAGVVAGARSRGLWPVLVGSRHERELCAAIATRAQARATVLAGQLEVREFVALVAQARALIGNDSGPAHVAAAVGTPVVSVFGPTAPQQGYAAFGMRSRVVEHPDLACRPCSSHGPRVCPAGHFRCMREVTADQVLGELDRLLGSH